MEERAYAVATICTNNTEPEITAERQTTTESSPTRFNDLRDDISYFTVHHTGATLNKRHIKYIEQRDLLQQLLTSSNHKQL